MYIFSSFTANTLLVHKFKCLASFTKCTCSTLVFFCTVFQFFTLLFASSPLSECVFDPGVALGIGPPHSRVWVYVYNPRTNKCFRQPSTPLPLVMPIPSAGLVQWFLASPALPVPLPLPLSGRMGQVLLCRILELYLDSPECSHVCHSRCLVLPQILLCPSLICPRVFSPYSHMDSGLHSPRRDCANPIVFPSAKNVTTVYTTFSVHHHQRELVDFLWLGAFSHLHFHFDFTTHRYSFPRVTEQACGAFSQAAFKCRKFFLQCAQGYEWYWRSGVHFH